MMHFSDIIKIILVFLCLAVTVCGNIKVFRVYSRFSDPLLRKLKTLVIVFLTFPCCTRLSALASSLIFHEWPYGKIGCLLYGFFDLVIYSSATWILCIVSIERYFKFIRQADHLSTFSSKNVNIMVFGVSVLMTLLATGPLYGLGDYTYFRGHLKITVSVHLIAENETTENMLLYKPYYFRLLEQEIDPTSNIQNIFNHAQVQVNHISKTNNGYYMFVRCPNKWIAEMIWRNNTDGCLADILKNILWKPGIGRLLGARDLGVHTDIDEDDYKRYVNIYLVTQDLGVCGTDWTSNNVNSLVWAVYQTVVTSGLPYLLLAPMYLLIYCLYPHKSSKTDKAIDESDIIALRFFRITAILCFTFTVVYITISIGNMRGFYISNDLNFALTLMYYTSGISVFLAAIFVEYDIANRLWTIIQFCWFASTRKFSVELPDLSTRKKSWHRMKQQRKLKRSLTYL